MAGTRTAPTVSDITATTIGVTLHLVDASGDLTTDYVDAINQDLLDIEAFVDAYQASTNASVWKVTFSLEFEGECDPDNAQALFRASVAEGVNMLFKDTTNSLKQTPRLYAPISAVMQGNQDIPLLTATEMTALINAYLDLLNNGSGTTYDYRLDSAQYTARRERANNPRLRV